MESLIDIIIPTFNRASDLSENLQLLSVQIRKDSLQDKVQIIISDNHSSDNTEKIATTFISANTDIRIDFFRQNENIGMEKNFVYLMSKCNSKYFMFLGDDDFLPEDYLRFCIETTSADQNLGCIIPGIYQIDGKKKIISDPRPAKFDTKRGTKGFNSMLKYSHWGHQLSGILFLRSNVLHDYLKYDEYRNVYLFIYLAANRILQYDVLYAPCYKISVTVTNSKYWDYNDIGLLDVVYMNYYPFLSELGPDKVGKLMLQFTLLHSYRLHMRISSPIKLFRQYLLLRKKTNHVRGFSASLLLMLMKDYLLLFIKK